MKRTCVYAVAIFCVSFTPALGAQGVWPARDRLQPEACTAATGDAANWLRRADSATGLTALGNRVLSFRAVDSYSDMIESDRAYPPFLKRDADQQWWFDAASGVERWGPVTPAKAPRPRDYVRNEQSTLPIADSIMQVSTEQTANRNAVFANFFSPTRGLNPLAVLRDWERADGVTVAERCVFRDYPRIVLQRKPGGDRLYLDAKTAVPVKLERYEPHYLWGQVHVEYVYATWWQAGPAMYPISSTRYIDGVPEWNRTPARPNGDAAIAISRDSSPVLSVPPKAAPSGYATLPGFAPDVPVDTIRAGQNTFLLVTQASTHAVTLARDTVYLLDATTGEARSRADSLWITKLFPGKHPVVVVVTDVAWPHVSGIRFWAASGATFVTHAISKPVLEQIIARRWTLVPDALEAARARVHPVIKATTGPLDLAGGAVRLAPIDGIASEGALIAFIAGDQFLWASDYIQSVSAPSLYAREVYAAVQRVGFAPARAGAEHLLLLQWPAVEAVAKPR